MNEPVWTIADIGFFPMLALETIHSLQENIKLKDEALKRPVVALDDLLDGLKAVVQYRRVSPPQRWITMAAFDSEDVAEMYAKECSSDNSPWEYQVIPLKLGEGDGF